MKHIGKQALRSAIEDLEEGVKLAKNDMKKYQILYKETHGHFLYVSVHHLEWALRKLKKLEAEDLTHDAKKAKIGDSNATE